MPLLIAALVTAATGVLLATAHGNMLDLAIANGLAGIGIGCSFAAMPALMTTAPRRRDAAATRRALLDAARELFDARGFRGTTVRAIGERAGVDQALIARYFGGKGELYQAVLDEDRLASDAPTTTSPAPPPERRTPREVIDVLLARVDENGVGPVLRALTDPDTEAATRDELGGRLRDHVTAPLAAWLQEAGVADPALRAEVVVASLLGVMITRATGGLPRVAEAQRDELAALLEEMLGGGHRRRR